MVKRLPRKTVPEVLNTSKKAPKGPSYRILFFLPIIVAVAGLFFVFESSSIRAYNETGNSFNYLKLQTIWVVAGIVLMFVFSFFDYKKLYILAFPIMVITIVLLLLVLIPGVGHKAGGARSWIDLGFFNLQPAELAKFSTILYLASWFTTTDKKRFFSFLGFLGLLMGLILLQPDVGTGMIVFSLAVAIYFLAGMQIYYLLSLIPMLIIALIGLIAAAPYRFQRIQAFMDPSSSTQDYSYHINQILISLSQGGILGRGLGASRQKYLFLPEAHTDSIFAIIGEEFGFVGGFLIIFVFFILLYKLYSLYHFTSDRFAKLLIGGIMSYFSLQIIINLGGMVNLMPLTGVPLPFISYGGSHTIISFMLIGIALNIARKK